MRTNLNISMSYDYVYHINQIEYFIYPRIKFKIPDISSREKYKVLDPS